MEYPSEWCEEVYSYGTKVTDVHKFRPVNPYGLYFGLEIENQYNTKSTSQFCRTARKVMQYFNSKGENVILADDNSITKEGYTGAELITMPCSVEHHLQVMKDYWSTMGDELLYNEHAGMHVHVSRIPLTKLTISKMVVFLNLVENRQFVIHVAGRESERYCAFKDKKFTSVNEEYQNKYEILNLQPQYTVEFRLFSVPSSYEEFAYKLQFTEACVYFAQNVGMKNLHYRNFCLFVSTNRKKWNHLYKFLKTKRYVSDNLPTG